MPSPVDSALHRPARWSPDDAAAGFAAALLPARMRPVQRPAVAAIVLSIAGAAAPVAVALAAALNGPVWPPLAASALVALLVAAPAGVALAAVLVGMRRLGGLAQWAEGDGEHAALRVSVATLLFGYALLLLPLRPSFGSPDADIGNCVPIAAAELVAAWTLLLCVILWPTTSALRRFLAIVLDLSLLSAFLHCGGRQVAGWYPLYILVTFYAGLRFGLGALLTAATASVVGFVAVAASTPAWREQPALAIGLLLALVSLPGFLGATVRRAAAARDAAARAEADRQHTLLAIARSLRDRSAADGGTAPLLGTTRIDDILDFAALETGTFPTPLVTFELRALIRRTLTPLQALAADRGVLLRWRADPCLPNRLRGQAETLTRILRSVAELAIATADGRVARLAVDAGPREADRVRLDLRIESGGRADDPDTQGEPLAMTLVRRLAALAGGTCVIERRGNRPSEIIIALGFAIEPELAPPMLDLDRRPVLIVSDDENLAQALAEPLDQWNADRRWPADADQAIAELALADDGKRAILIVDGRYRLMTALGVTHQAAKMGVNAPFVLLIAHPEQIAGLVAVDDGELDGVIPAPPTTELLAHALDALPLAPERARRPGATDAAASAPPAPPPLRPASKERPADALGGAPDGRGAVASAARITPIAVHPKFVPEAAAVDARALEGLQALGGDETFLREVIEAFRLDTEQIMERVTTAVAAGDGHGFSQGLVALRRAAGQLGGVHLCALTASLQHRSAAELRERGSVYLQRLDVEIRRLTQALTAFAAAEEESRP